MDTFNEFENYRRKYLCDYYKKMFLMCEKNNLFEFHRMIVNKYTFSFVEIFSIIYILKNFQNNLGTNKIFSSRIIYKYSTMFIGITLINMNIFLRNFMEEYPFQNQEISKLEEMKLSKLNETHRYKNKLQCLLLAITSPGFCIYKDAFILKFLNIALLPYIIYLNYKREINKDKTL